MKKPMKPYNCSDQNTPSWKARRDKSVELLINCLNRSESVTPVVGDFGCGNCEIEQLLGEKTKEPFQYYGYDVNPKTSSAVRMDLNNDFPSGIKFDVAVSLGLLEYLTNVPDFLKKMRENCSFVILSYVFNSGLYSADDIAKLGWVNHFELDEINSILIESGFQWNEEMILEEKYILRLLY